jgi:hypothetical protein
MRKKKDVDDDESKLSNYTKKKNNIIHSHKAKLGLSVLQKHDEQMNYFRCKDKVIKEYNKEIEVMRQDIEKLNTEIAVYEANNKDSHNLKQKIKDINSNIRTVEETKYNLVSGEAENQYFLSVFRLVNEYYKLEEDEQKVFKENTDGVEQKLFQINLQKKVISDEYFTILDPSYRSSNSAYDNSLSNCQKCKSVTKLVMEAGFAVCYDCGNAYTGVHQATEPSYKEAQEMDFRSQFTYDKKTHLQEWLRRFQAKEQKDIPQEILDKVLLEAKKERISNLNTLTETKVKGYLKKLNLNDYYDNIISIINRINKRQPFTLTPEIEDKIMEMFQQIQDPFEKYKDPKRKNMLSYSFILNKFFLILGLPEFSKYFFLLKSPEKLRQQDETFKKIVDHMAKIDTKTPWTFHPSL